MIAPLRIPLAIVGAILLLLSVLLANFLQMLTLVVVPFSPRFFRTLNRQITGAWFQHLSSTLVLLGVEFRFSGHAVPRKENAILVSNHQAMADIPALVTLACRAGTAGDLKWFVKDPIKWVPGIGWGMKFLDCLFVKRNWTADKDKVIATFEKIRTHRSPFWVVSFLEGTRITPAKKARSQAFAKKSKLPSLEHVMLPRSKGFEATLEGLGDLNQAIYVATIGYEGPAPSLPKLFASTRVVHVHVQRFTSWPAANRAGWIVDRYVEMDKHLAGFYAKKSF